MDLKGWASSLASRGQRLAREGLTYVNQQIVEKQQLRGLSFPSLSSASPSSSSSAAKKQQRQQQRRQQCGTDVIEQEEEEEEEEEERGDGAAGAAAGGGGAHSAAGRKQHFAASRKAAAVHSLPAVLHPSSLVFYVLQQEASPPPFAQLFPVPGVQQRDILPAATAAARHEATAARHDAAAAAAELLSPAATRAGECGPSARAAAANANAGAAEVGRPLAPVSAAASAATCASAAAAECPQLQWNAFLLPAGISCDCVSLQLFQRLFPHRGSFVFRFRVPCAAAPAGHVWQEVAAEDAEDVGGEAAVAAAAATGGRTFLPCCEGKLICKALQLPPGVRPRRLAPHCRAALAAAARAEAAAAAAAARSADRQRTAAAAPEATHGEGEKEGEQGGKEEEGGSLGKPFYKEATEGSFLRGGAAVAACGAAVAAAGQAVATLPQLFGRRSSSRSRRQQHICGEAAAADTPDAFETESETWSSSPAPLRPQSKGRAREDYPRDKKGDEEEEAAASDIFPFADSNNVRRRKEAASLPSAPERRRGAAAAAAPACRHPTAAAVAVPSSSSPPPFTPFSMTSDAAAAGFSSAAPSAAASSLLFHEESSATKPEASGSSLLFDVGGSGVAAASASAWPDVLLGEAAATPAERRGSCNSSSHSSVAGRTATGDNDLFGETEKRRNDIQRGAGVRVAGRGAAEGGERRQCHVRSGGRGDKEGEGHKEREEGGKGEKMFDAFLEKEEEEATKGNDATEPLDREKLAAGRRARTEQRVQEKLQETQEWRQTELARRQDLLRVPDEVRQQLAKWAKGNDGCYKDIRTLLCSVHEVLWDGAEWEEVSISTLMISHQVKRYYRKALLLTHPDKHQSSSAEQLYRAEKIFQAFNEAYKKHSI